MIFELHRRVVGALPDEHRARELLAESAEIVLSELPSVSAEALRLEALWSEKSLLDPGEADRVLDELAAELERIEPRLERLLAGSARDRKRAALASS